LQLTVSLADKKQQLEDIIGQETRSAVACSGGVDSTLLLKVTRDVLGPENTIAVFADTPLLPPGESEAVREVVDLIGSRLLTVSFDPLSWPEFTANPLERCYLCKKKIYQTFLDKLIELDFAVLMDGTNLDDLSDFRPGLKALDELKIKKPLAEAGLTKKEIRQLSRDMNLPNWNKYSSSCLATRIATGQHISKEKLDLIRKCESILHGFGFMGCRARISNDSVILELQMEDIERFAQESIRQPILKKFNDFRVEEVFLSMSGRKGIHL
jgi:uncharacterized protein